MWNMDNTFIKYLSWKGGQNKSLHILKHYFLTFEYS
jgi:hypothetical protein